VTWQEQLGATIRAARIAAGWSQADVASALEVRQSSVSQWEAGRTAPSTGHLLGLLRLFGDGLIRLLVGVELAESCRLCAASAAHGQGSLPRMLHRASTLEGVLVV
jgi:transcriptional regulator with XRE-family HTH domain